VHYRFGTPSCFPSRRHRNLPPATSISKATPTELLEGAHRLSRFDEHTTQTCAVAFNDSTGEQRVLDFLSHPYGLDAERVSERAIPLDIDAGGPAPVRISVMHPLDCLRSRVANSDLPNRATDQLRRGSVPLSRSCPRIASCSLTRTPTHAK
jgi:hypothetical protein